MFVLSTQQAGGEEPDTHQCDGVAEAMCSPPPYRGTVRCSQGEMLHNVPSLIHKHYLLTVYI